ncbi:hypothetical protein SNE35_29880 [Paucibacter sp. R3-3]|uniref:CBS domain-containing protein n=1 Tax=Roseateles agri TaxID=3098619 RepID=A0ABU5DR07_9BURK|nr:hypothetical protein [Paucibacter sp. R3-3]MDY0748746.1 hypothetical protein [Paucibacter sp. R3-3]
MNPKIPVEIPTLSWSERVYYRDQLRAGRYAALADAEGFQAICFAVEALGMRLYGKKEALGGYKTSLAVLARDSLVLSELAFRDSARFSDFGSLFGLVYSARNDAMHTGVYARHATAAAIELCIGLEEALMKEQQIARRSAKDFMVKSPIIVEPWQPIAYARQLMLTHSFSFIPVYIENQWWLISEGAMARFLNVPRPEKMRVFAVPITEARAAGLTLIKAEVIDMNTSVDDLLSPANDERDPRLWLVEENPGRLCGVLSPFELM